MAYGYLCRSAAFRNVFKIGIIALVISSCTLELVWKQRSTYRKGVRKEMITVALNERVVISAWQTNYHNFNKQSSNKTNISDRRQHLRVFDRKDSRQRSHECAWRWDAKVCSSELFNYFQSFHYDFELLFNFFQRHFSADHYKNMAQIIVGLCRSC